MEVAWSIVDGIVAAASCTRGARARVAFVCLEVVMIAEE